MPLLARPDKFPRWATVPTLDALSGQPNRLEPPDAKKDTGFHYREKPPRNWWNWLQGKNADWEAFLAEQKETLHGDLLPNSFRTAPTITTGPGLLVTVTSDTEVWFNGEAFEQPASAGIVLPALSTRYLYLDTDRVYKVTSSATTASAGDRLVLAQIITDGAGVANIDEFKRLSSRRTHKITVGPTDCDFTDLQSAVDHASLLAAQTAEPRVEVVIAGDVVIPSTVIIPSAVRLRGSALGTLQWSFVNAPALEFQSALASYSRIVDVTFQYTGGAPGGAHVAILVSSAITDVRLTRCQFIDVRRAILATAAAARWRVDGCLFQATTSDVATIIDTSTNCNGWIVEGNHFRGPSGVALLATAIDLGGSDRCLIHGNTFEGYNQQVKLDAACSAVIVAMNGMSGARREAIESFAPDSIIANNTIDGAQIGGGANDAAIRLYAAAVRSSVIENSVTNWSAGWAIVATAVELQIDENSCVLTAGSATVPAISGGISCVDTRCQINGNSIDLLTTAAAGGGKQRAYGIKAGVFADPVVGFSVNTTDLVICGNRIRNIGGDLAGGVAIDVGGRSVVQGNYTDNVYGLQLRISGPDTTVGGNMMVDYGKGDLVAPYVGASNPFLFTSTASRGVFVGNIARTPATTLVSGGYFETGCVDVILRDNQIQASAGFPLGPMPVNLGQQRFGNWEVSGQTVGNVTVDLTPVLTPLPVSSAFAVRALVRGEEAASTDVNAYELLGGITTDAGGLIVASTFLTAHSLEMTGPPAAVFVVVGGALVVRVTGEGGKTFNWHGLIELENQVANRFYQ
jgi:hypothetical protein